MRNLIPHPSSTGGKSTKKKGREERKREIGSSFPQFHLPPLRGERRGGKGGEERFFFSHHFSKWKVRRGRVGGGGN